MTDLPAAFVAYDVPAAFCALVVFVDASMIAYDYWGLMIGAALSVYVDAAILFSQKMMNGWVFERFLELLEVLFWIVHLCFSLWPGCLVLISLPRCADAASIPVAAMCFLCLGPCLVAAIAWVSVGLQPQQEQRFWSSST